MSRVSGCVGLACLFQSRPGKVPAKGDASASETSDAPPNVNLEPHILVHVLSFYRILLLVGSAEVNDLWTANSASQEQIPLAQNISAVFRRTLPALRILSKWIMGQLEYIDRVQNRVEAKERKLANSQQTTQDAQDPAIAADQSLEVHHLGSFELQDSLDKVWSAYADFNNSIKLAFPLDALPNAREDGVWLEEDVDLLGFAPLRRSTREGVGAAEGVLTEASRVGKDVHPNEEQLMRLAELQADALLVAEAEASNRINDPLSCD